MNITTLQNETENKEVSSHTKKKKKRAMKKRRKVWTNQTYVLFLLKGKRVWSNQR